MPYRKRSSTSSRRRRSRYSKRAPVKSRAVRSLVRREIHRNQEVKVYSSHFHETSLSSLTAYWAADICAPTQGTALYDRTGNKIKVTGVRAKILFQNPTTKPIMLRCLALSTRDPNDIVDTSEIFKAASGSAQSLNSLGANTKLMTYPINNVKYKVLKSKFIYLTPATGEYGKNVAWFSFFKKLNADVTFEGSAVGANNQSRRFHIVIFATEPSNDVGLGESIEMSGYYASYYTDS